MSDVERSARPSLVFLAAPSWHEAVSVAVHEGPGAIDDVAVQAFVALLLDAPDAAVDAFLERLTDAGVAAERIYLDLLAPAARELGDRWCDDRCDFVTVTIGCSRMQRVLRDLSHVFHAEPTGGSRGGDGAHALITTVPGEQHTFGLGMLGEFFLRDGWDVCVAPPRSEAELLTLIRDRWFDMVGFSVACDARIERLTREIRRVRRFARNRRVVVLVGGSIFDERPGLVTRVGADGTASDAASAPLVARRLLLERGGPWPEHLPS